MVTLQLQFRGLGALRRSVLSSALLALIAASPSLMAQRVLVSARSLTASTPSVDTGSSPSSQPLNVTLRLAPPPDRQAALDQLLANQADPSSSSYHQWLTPQQFAQSYGATDDQLTAITTWAQSQGLSVASISAGKMRLTLSGSVDQVQRAFAISIHSYYVPGLVSAQPRFANATAPSVPAEIASMVAGISGLDNLPPAVPASISSTSVTGRTRLLSTPDSDPIAVAADAVDANADAILTLSPTACSTALSTSDVDAYRALFRQANAQGITIVGSCPATDGSSTGSTVTQPNALFSLPEITALTTSSALSDSIIAPSEARPAWQVAPGLPGDADRHQPDLTTTSTTAFAQTMSAIVRTPGGRQGNINATLYSLATTPDLYIQPDATPAGTWESATGLGTVNLDVLAKVFPRAGSFATTTSLSANKYAINYGDTLILTSKVLAPVYTTAQPTGTVSFSATGQILGSATIDSSGTASFTLPAALPVGVYNITATYGGDANYASSSSAPPIIVTVSIVNATIVATVSPSTAAPYGSTATVTATVSLPGANGAPSGTVTAVVESVTGSSSTATLSPNPGGNTATANIPIAIPPPGTYTIEVSCAGNANFQCQSPVDIANFKTVKGNTLITVTTIPVAPQAGQPVTITANVSAAGNGPGPYNFTGTMTFYDNGKLIATGAVASNQAAASVSLSGNITHNIVASYSGDTNWNASTSAPAAVNPTLLPATLTLTSNVTTALAGTNVVLTATVFTTVANTVGPTGTVSLYDTFNGSIIQLGGSSGAVTLTPNGPNQSIARYTSTGLLAGTHSIYAVYNGDANFSTATSSTMPLTLTDYTLIMVPPSITITAGQTGQATMLLGLIGGFSGSVSFGCTPPAGSEMTCGFTQPLLQGGGTTTMTIATTAPHAKPVQQSRNHTPQNPWSLGAGSALAALICFALPRRRRALPLLVTTLFALALIPSLGCGLGGTPPSDSSDPKPPTDPGSPLGTQFFTITTAGTDGVNVARHIYQYQVTVQ